MNQYLRSALVCLLATTMVLAASKPRIFSLNADYLSQTKARLADKDALLLPAFSQLRNEADKALQRGPYSVTFKERTPPSQDKHDYLSLAPYFWPDANTKDGLPYIRRDGETNPDSKKGTDANTIAQMGKDVGTLGLAFYFTGNEAYAAHATKLIRTWFLDADTKMNPHFKYAQAVLGRNDGRGTGLIEARNFIHVVEAAGLLAESKAWTAQDQQALQAWFRAFTQWMQTSPHGKDEAKAKNNHGSWYAAQLACYAMFIGDEALARQTAEAAKTRIAWQIEPDGKQPLELERTKSFGYTVFNLNALMTLAEVAQRVGVDLYNYKTADGRSLRRALDYTAPFLDATKAWPDKQIVDTKSDRAELAELLRRASLIYQEKSYEELLAKPSAAEATKQRWQLLWPLRK